MRPPYWLQKRTPAGSETEVFFRVAQGCRILFIWLYCVCIIQIRDVDTLWELIRSRIADILEVMCPYKNVCLRDPRTPWITAEIIKAINDRKKYLRLFYKTGNQYIFEICKYLRNRCNSLIRTAKAAYIKDNLLRSAGDPKKFWRSIKNILKGPKNETVIYEFVDSSTGDMIDKDNVCNYLNDYYANVGISTQRDRCVKPIWSTNDQGYVFEPVTRDETVKLISEIDNGKDSCVEGLSSLILKDGFGSLIPQITYLFNTSLEQCLFPREWAKGFINILPKGGNLKDPSNWRPITQTPLPAKMLEKIVQKRFLNILTDSNYISEYQYGFVPGKSTQLAIFDILKEINTARNSKLHTGLLFLDVRKAFDSLDHNILLAKLQGLGVSGKMLDWFFSYLDRTQRVRHDGNISDECKFKCGIPQGSCLGPTLFIFYINDVFMRITNDVKIMMFADDCVLYKSDEKCDVIIDILQESLNVYIDWGADNNMHLNVKKTKAMIISPCVHQNLYRPLLADNMNIHYVRQFNYLGVIIDDQLTYTPYYNAVKRKVENKIFVLSKIRRYVDCKTALLIYKQAILPLMEYAGFVLISCNLGQRQELQKLQNNALRKCKKYFLRDRVQINILHNECTILGLEQRRRKQLLRLMYIHSKNVSNLKRPARPTRAGSKLVFNTPTKCTTKYMCSPFFKGNRLWNELSEELQRSYNVLRFTQGLNILYKVYEEMWWTQYCIDITISYTCIYGHIIIIIICNIRKTRSDPENVQK